MYGVDLYRRVRLACHRGGLSRREASRQFGIDRKTVAKILLHSEPPGYRRRQPPKRPKLAPFTDIIDGILEEDRTVHRKQRHTAKRIFERLRDEHGFTGKQTIVKDYVRERHLGLREMFVPLAHPPGHAQADFGEADASSGGRGGPGLVRPRNFQGGQQHGMPRAKLADSGLAKLGTKPKHNVSNLPLRLDKSG